MNFMRVEGALESGSAHVALEGHEVSVPRLQQSASGELALGVRPEHIHFTDKAGYRGKVLAAEYLGTTQIVTLDTPNGEIKARVPSSLKCGVGDLVGLTFDVRTLTVFDNTGRALLSDANSGVLGHG